MVRVSELLAVASREPGMVLGALGLAIPFWLLWNAGRRSTEPIGCPLWFFSGMAFVSCAAFMDAYPSKIWIAALCVYANLAVAMMMGLRVWTVGIRRTVFSLDGWCRPVYVALGIAPVLERRNERRRKAAHLREVQRREEEKRRTEEQQRRCSHVWKDVGYSKYESTWSAKKCYKCGAVKDYEQWS